MTGWKRVVTLTVWRVVFYQRVERERTDRCGAQRFRQLPGPFIVILKECQGVRAGRQRQHQYIGLLVLVGTARCADQQQQHQRVRRGTVQASKQPVPACIRP